MPYVNVKITKDGFTPEQKRRVVGDITRTLVETSAKNPSTSTS
jgi:4-oxalocrotonate tautomerase